jgi:hypothetical protein
MLKFLKPYLIIDPLKKREKLYRKWNVRNEFELGPMLYEAWFRRFSPNYARRKFKRVDMVELINYMLITRGF